MHKEQLENMIVGENCVALLILICKMEDLGKIEPIAVSAII